jgi:DNA-binding transcriptional regulator YhcF (GntR family)
MEKISDPRLWLEAEYLARKKKNPSYSLRAFSRQLRIPSGRISQLLTKKRKFTPALGKKIAEQLNCDPLKTGLLLESISKSRTIPKEPELVPEYRELDMDQFQSVADPLHFSILSLFETDGFLGDLRSVASQLEISPVEARAALERLERLGFLRPKKKGWELAAAEDRTTSHDVSSAALREAHKKVLAESLEAIDAIAVELRDITSITMAIDPSKLGEAKEKIRNFRRSLSQFLESGKRTEVYRVNVQLVPVTKKGKR